MVKANAIIAMVIAKIIFPFIVLNFDYYTNLRIKFDILNLLIKVSIVHLFYRLNTKA